MQPQTLFFCFRCRLWTVGMTSLQHLKALSESLFTTIPQKNNRTGNPLKLCKGTASPGSIWRNVWDFPWPYSPSRAGRRSSMSFLFSSNGSKPRTVADARIPIRDQSVPSKTPASIIREPGAKLRASLKTSKKNDMENMFENSMCMAVQMIK